MLAWSTHWCFRCVTNYLLILLSSLVPLLNRLLKGGAFSCRLDRSASGLLSISSFHFLALLSPPAPTKPTKQKNPPLEKTSTHASGTCLLSSFCTKHCGHRVSPDASCALRLKSTVLMFSTPLPAMIKKLALVCCWQFGYYFAHIGWFGNSFSTGCSSPFWIKIPVLMMVLIKRCQQGVLSAHYFGDSTVYVGEHF